MWYTYVIESLKDGEWYVGSTDDLKRRLEEHNKGYVGSTKNRRPLKLIYYEACLNEKSARRREKYLKTAWGKRYLRKRLRE